MLSFMGLLVSVIGISGFVSFRVYLNDYRLRQKDWKDLVGMLEQLPVDGIKAVAIDHLEPGPGQLRLSPAEVFDLVGSFDGLSSMYMNTRILCALAAHAERWNFEEAYVVTGRIRMEAWTVRTAIFQIVFRCLTPSLRLNMKVPFLLQEATAAYYLMSTRVLSLYETTHVARLSVLRAAM